MPSSLGLFLRLGRPARLLPWVAAAALGLAACSRREAPIEAGRRTETLLLGNAAEPADLDPQIVDALTDVNIDYALFESLTWIDERTTRPIPAAAERWDVSADGRVYTFHLRPTGRWSNGEPVTADDFVYAYRRILTPALAASYSYMLWPIENAQPYNQGKLTDFSRVGVRAVDPLTLRVVLERPTPYLPALAAHETWMPLHRATIERFGRIDERGTAWTQPGNLVGNGPFVLREWIRNGRIVVDKNPRYWNAGHVRLNHIMFFPIENDDAEELAFRAGQLHVTYGVPLSRVAAHQRDDPGRLRIDREMGSFYLFFNVHRPPLDNLRLRQALALAIDRTAIAKDVLLGTRTPAHALTPPDCAGYTARAAVPDDFAAARRLLAAAGYPGGRGLPILPALSYTTEVSVRTLEAIQRGWDRELGVHITITPQEQKTLFQNEHDRNYSIAMSGWAADYADPSTFLNTMVSGGGNNWAGWSDPVYDRLLGQAAQSANNGRRYELFQQAEARLLEAAPLAPLYYGERPFLIQTSVRGWQPAPIFFHRFADIWLE